jgi:hypothetical protein
MFNVKKVVIGSFAVLTLYSCSKRNHPFQSPGQTVITDSIAVLAKKEPVKTKPKTIIPKVIVVNDSVAHKSVDGRYYYDLLGHRYWRNNKDGKYYLFNKSMFDDKAFQAKGN